MEFFIPATLLVKERGSVYAAFNLIDQHRN